MHLETLWRWRVAIMASVVGVLAAMTRFVGLSSPKELVFDELYYARGAFSLVHLGFEGDWTGENQAFAEGDYSGLRTDHADYVVHPMLGKLLIAVGIKMFGATPYGWRFSGAFLGTVTVVLIALIARHLFQSTIWGTLAGVFLAVEGQHVSLSRVALLDIFLTFFVVVAFGLLLIDRTRTHAKVMAQASRDRASLGLNPQDSVPGWGPRVGVRWWRFGAMVAFGLAAGVKWSALFIAAALLLWSVAWDRVDRRTAGYERWHVGSLVRAVPAGVLALVTIPTVYVATWLPWFLEPQSYRRNWAEKHPGEGVTWLPEALRSLVEYHAQMLTFHRGLDTYHTYKAAARNWLIQARPTAMHFQDVDNVDCGADRCVSTMYALGHPFLWWAMVAALIFVAWRVLRKRDMLAVTVSLGMLAGWVPWLAMPSRTMFTFYTVVMSPFVVLMVVWAARHIAQPERLEGGWSRKGVLVVGGYTALVLIAAGFFLPLWTGYPIPYEYWQIHPWLPGWSG
ncbi:MAG: phospholipid carrier-dependent glycosyltransferase [Actinobacteria bacterium HGW-Actinobacteria-4]|nr:MAG: phospholipid carrier-dependent glycosyltransferase [Actinobacteria bacterium HGW-Actinobacteria-4]